MAVASLILGILSLICVFFPVAGIIGVIFSIIAIILGAIGRKHPEGKGMATAGLVCGIIGFILNIIFFVLCAGFLAAVGAASTAGAL